MKADYADEVISLPDLQDNEIPNEESSHQISSSVLEEVSVADEPEEIEVPIDELVEAIRENEKEYFDLFGRAAALEGALKAKQQDFDTENESLIVAKKAAIAERDIACTALKALAVQYGRRTSEKRFDQYIGFRTNRTISWNEAEAIAWLEDNFPAALVKAGVSVDGSRFKSYILDCLKRSDKLPPSVTITSHWEATISKKLPVPNE